MPAPAPDRAELDESSPPARDDQISSVSDVVLGEVLGVGGVRARRSNPQSLSGTCTASLLNLAANLPGAP